MAAHLYTAKSDGFWWSGNTKGTAWSTDPGGGDQSGDGPDWSESNQPWVVPAGESLTDNMPSGVTILDYDDHAQGTDLGATLTAAASAATGPFVLRLDGNTTYHLTSFKPTWSNAGACWFDSGGTKKWCGLLGAGADSTVVEVDPEILTPTQIDDISQGKRSPTQYFTLYMASPPKPAFISGINFRGNLQQVGPLTTLTGTAPMPYEGVHFDTVPAGSRIQFCRFQGLGFTAKNSPPYELGAIGSLHSIYTIYRTEVDGRQAAEINPAQPRSGGGIMQNNENSTVTLDKVWMHHSRQTAWATHDDSKTNAVYDCMDCRFNDLSHRDPGDTWATDGHEMQPIHVEAATNSPTWSNTRLHTTHATKAHIALLTPSGFDMAEQITIEDCVSENTDYNGCIVVAIYKESNGSPYWLAYDANGAAGLPITATWDGQPLTAVDVSQFNASQHFPETHYIIRPT